MDHNVFILGAGFSEDAGFPLISNFKAKLLQAEAWLETEKRTDELESVQKVLAFRRQAASACERIRFNPDNIEQLFSLAAVTNFSLSQDVIKAISATLAYCDASFEARPKVYRSSRSVPDQSGGWRTEAQANGTLFAHFADILSPNFGRPAVKNTVITLNYDTLLERGFNDAGHAFSYDSEGDATSVKLLKIHGSVSWSGTKVYDSYNQLREAGDTPVLIPPTWSKTVIDAKIQRSWDLARAALHDAKRIVIIGFSLPPTDYHFRFLLASGLIGNIRLEGIWIVNPNLESVSPNLEGLFTTDVQEIIQRSNLNAFGLIQSSGNLRSYGINAPEYTLSAPSYRDE